MQSVKALVIVCVNHTAQSVARGLVATFYHTWSVMGEDQVRLLIAGAIWD